MNHLYLAISQERVLTHKMMIPFDFIFGRLFFYCVQFGFEGVDLNNCFVTFPAGSVWTALLIANFHLF